MKVLTQFFFIPVKLFLLLSPLILFSDNNKYLKQFEQFKTKDISVVHQVYTFMQGKELDELPSCLEGKEINPASLVNVPDCFVETLILLEDQHFYHHQGLDHDAIQDALISNLKAGKIVKGGSTISQQLAKMIINDYSRNISRKFREAQLAKEIERKYSKDDILTMYINLLYFGHSLYGIDKASQYFFKKQFESLTEVECTFLAGLISSPKRFSPIYDRKNSQKRHLFVLKLYANRKKIPFQKYKESYKQFWKNHQWVDPEDYLNDFDYTIITDYE